MKKPVIPSEARNLPAIGGRCFVAALLSMTIAGCAGPKITAEDVAIAAYQAEAQRACYAAQQLPPYADARDAALVLMARSLGGDPCRATNVYDARAKIAEAQNAAAGRIVGNIASAGIAGIGIIAGADVMKTAVKSAGTRITGDSNIITRAEGSASATGPDMSTTTTTTTTTHHGPEARP